jgi:hypothetical protein
VTLITESAPARTTGPGRPALPNDRGPISAAVLPFLRGDAAADSLRDVVPAVPTADPYGDDAQLALYVAYELHYLGFAGVDDSCEWEPELLALRRALEQRFEASLHADVAGGDDVDGEIAALLVEPVEGEGPSWFLRREGDHDQLREYLAHHRTDQRLDRRGLTLAHNRRRIQRWTRRPDKMFRCPTSTRRRRRRPVGATAFDATGRRLCSGWWLC